MSRNGKAPLVLGIAVAACLVTAAIATEQNAHRHAAHVASLQRTAFGDAMAEAMRRMHVAMALVHTGDADRDFAAMMIPHHQGAIDMAKAELLHGRDVALRRLAEGIIVEQQQEIELMQRRLQELSKTRGQTGDVSVPSRE